MEQDTGFEPALPVWKTGVLAANTSPALWGERWDLNPRQPGPQPGALPTELRPPWLRA